MGCRLGYAQVGADSLLAFRGLWAEKNLKLCLVLVFYSCFLLYIPVPCGTAEILMCLSGRKQMLGDKKT